MKPVLPRAASSRESTVVTKSLNLQHEYKADDWKLSSQVGYTSASGGRSARFGPNASALLYFGDQRPLFT